MKYGLLVFGACMFAGCLSANGKGDVSSTPAPVVPLMPYYLNERPDKSVGPMGYVNAETLEVVIPSQYYEAFPFTGDFAIVQPTASTFWHYPKRRIINKENAKILEGSFHNLKLIQMENSPVVFAVTGRNSGIRFAWGGHFIPELYISNTRTTYRLYNLFTGKKVLTFVKKWYDSDPRIVAVGDHLIVDDTVYTIKQNGGLQKEEMHKEEAIHRIIENRGLTYNKPDSLDDFNDPYHWYVNTFDVDALEQLIPSDLKIMTFRDRIYYDTGTPSFRSELVTLYEIHPINRDLIHPLHITEILYEVRLEDKSDHYLQYRGLYSADRKKWIIEPLKGRGRFWPTDFNDFIETADYGFGLINIRTQEKYKTAYTETFNFRGPDNAPYGRYMYYNVWNK